MTRQTMQAPMPQVLISNPMRRKFNHRDRNIVAAPVSDQSLAGAVLYMREVTR